MATWKIGDLEVRSGGEASSELVQSRLQSGRAFYSYGPEPNGRWAVDPDNDWTIHQWAGEQGEVETDYEPDDEDMPKEVREYLALDLSVDKDERA